MPEPWSTPRQHGHCPRAGVPLKGLNTGFPKIRGTSLGAPIIRTTVFWGLHWGPTILGSYQIRLPKIHGYLLVPMKKVIVFGGSTLGSKCFGKLPCWFCRRGRPREPNSLLIAALALLLILFTLQVPLKSYFVIQGCWATRATLLSREYLLDRPVQAFWRLSAA